MKATTENNQQDDEYGETRTEKQRWFTVIAVPKGMDAHPAVQQVEQTLLDEVGIRAERHWRHEGRVCELWYDREPPKFLRRLIGKVEADIFTLDSGSREKKLFLSDMDSTIIQQECIDEIAHELGLRDEVAAITERAMRGDLVFEDSLRERVKLLTGLEASKLQEVFEKRITFSPGAKELIQALREHGVECVLVSGGFTFFTEKVATALGFHQHFANDLVIEDGRLTGDVAEPVFGPSGKEEVLTQLVEEMRIDYDEVLAIGDGANDVPMLVKAGLGVAYHAKPAVRDMVPAQINLNDLSILLDVLGLDDEAAATLSEA
jgi:phosphoserine phosphatase